MSYLRLSVKEVNRPYLKPPIGIRFSCTYKPKPGKVKIVLVIRLSPVASGKWATTLNVADLAQIQPATLPGKGACNFQGFDSTQYLGRVTMRPRKSSAHGTRPSTDSSSRCSPYDGNQALLLSVPSLSLLLLVLPLLRCTIDQALLLPVLSLLRRPRAPPPLTTRRSAPPAPSPTDGPLALVIRRSAPPAPLVLATRRPTPCSRSSPPPHLSRFDDMVPCPLHSSCSPYSYRHGDMEVHF
jgi:hypothetical protein